MLSISRLGGKTSNISNYYNEHDYYSGDRNGGADMNAEEGGKVQSKWFGKGAEMAGLDMTKSIDKKDLENMLNGIIDGQSLGLGGKKVQEIDEKKVVKDIYKMLFKVGGDSEKEIGEKIRGRLNRADDGTIKGSDDVRRRGVLNITMKPSLSDYKNEAMNRLKEVSDSGLLDMLSAGRAKAERSIKGLIEGSDATSINEFDKKLVKGLKSLNQDGLFKESADSLEARQKETNVGKHHQGWDFTFAPPKSLSIQALAGGDERVIEWHNKAVEQALKLMEQDGAVTRVKKDGQVKQVRVGNLIVGLFRHNTSRDNDMLIHTHALVMNAVKKGSKWMSIESTRLFKRQRVYRQEYDNWVAMLAREGGYKLEVDAKKGTYELAGVSKEAISIQSKRRKAILKAERDYGYKSAEGNNKATLRTRKAKIKGITEDTLMKTWKSEMEHVGFDPIKLKEEALANEKEINEIKASKGDGNKKRTLAKKMESLIERIKVFFGGYEIPKELAKGMELAVKIKMERNSGFKESEIILDAMKFNIGEVTHADVRKELMGMEKRGEIIRRQKKETDLYESGGQLKERTWHETYYTTQKEIDREKNVIEMMKDGQGSKKQIMTKKQAELAIKRVELSSGAELNKGQKEADMMILTNKDLIVGIQGYAGVGKTFMLGHLNMVFKSAGFEQDEIKAFGFDKEEIKAKGFAPTAVARDGLRDAGLESKTLASLLFTLKNKKDLSDYENNVWVIDEASMISTKDIQELIHNAKELNSRIVSVGDTAQLSSVEEGRMQELLIESGMKVAEVDEILRQKDEGLKRAVYEAIKGRDGVKEAFRNIGGNIHEVSQERKEELIEKYGEREGREHIKDEVIGNAIFEYQKLSKDEMLKEALFIVPKNQERMRANDEIRAELQKRGDVAKDDLGVETLHNKSIEKQSMVKTGFYEVGDIVRIRENGRTQEFEVKEKDDEKNTVFLSDGKKGFYFNVKNSEKYDNLDYNIYEKRETRIGEGDIIRVRETDNQKGIENGFRGEVISIDRESGDVKVENEDGRVVEFNTGEYKTWEHGYALTVNASQGLGFERVYTAFDTMWKNLVNQEAFYVTLSRAVKEVRMFVNDEKKAIKSIEERDGKNVTAQEINEMKIAREIERIDEETGVTFYKGEKEIELTRDEEGGKERNENSAEESRDVNNKENELYSYGDEGKTDEGKEGWSNDGDYINDDYMSHDYSSEVEEVDMDSYFEYVGNDGEVDMDAYMEYGQNEEKTNQKEDKQKPSKGFEMEI